LEDPGKVPVKSMLGGGGGVNKNRNKKKNPEEKKLIKVFTNKRNLRSKKNSFSALMGGGKDSRGRTPSSELSIGGPDQ